MSFWFFNIVGLIIMTSNDIFYLDFVDCSGWKDLVDEWVKATAAISGMNLFTSILF